MSFPDSSSTIEAQRDLPAKARSLRRFRDFFIGGVDVPDDVAERELKSAISKSSGDEHAFLKHLLRDYRRFKNSPCSAVSNNIVQCWAFQEGAADDIIRSQVDVLPADCEATFSAFITALSQHLLTTCPNGLRVLVISFEAIADNKNSFFTARHKIIATLLGRLNSLPLAPNNAIAILVAQSLKIPRPSLNFAKDLSIHDKRRRLLQPPSRSGSSPVLAGQECLLIISILEIPRGNLDPTQVEDNHIELTWQMNAPTFTNDFDIYIWEQYKALPIFRCVDMRLYPQAGTDETKLIILFRHSGSLRSFVKFRGDALIYRPTPATGVQIWSPNSEAFFSICAMFQVMILEMTEFLQGCSLELERMNLIVRQNPTTNKIRYLVHLEDCRESAHEGVVHGLQVLDSVSKWIDTQQMSQALWYAGESFQSRLATLRCDLDFFCDQFTKVGKEVKELQQTLHEHLDLTHNRRNFILTIIAAVYLPLSFAATFFGMNINTTTSAGPQGFSNWTTTWIDSSPADIQNSTKALVSTVGSSGALSYSWKTFIISAACLVFTLPLSLTIGGILHLAYRSTTYYATYWRIFAVLPSLAFIFFSIFELFDVISITCNIFLLIFVGMKSYQAWKSRQKLHFWIATLIFTSVSFSLTFFLWKIIPVMLIPWLFLCYAWIKPWWRRRQQEKARVQDAVVDGHLE